MSGYSDVIVLPAFQHHFKAAFAPLASAAFVQFELFLHMDGTLLRKDELPLLTSAARALGAVELKLYEDAPSRPPATNGQRMCPSAPGRRRNDECDCLTTGYVQNLKLRGCLASIEAREKQAASIFDFVVRMRSDVEFGWRVPPAAQWRRLSRDIIWAQMVEAGRADSSHAVHAMHAVELLDDQFAVVPRRAAATYFAGPGADIEACVPLSPNASQSTSCPGRWFWAECRVLHALRRLDGNLSAAPFPALRNMSMLNCGTRRGDIEGCLRTGARRRPEGNALRRRHLHAVSGPLLSEALPSSQFPSEGMY